MVNSVTPMPTPPMAKAKIAMPIREEEVVPVAVEDSRTVLMCLLIEVLKIPKGWSHGSGAVQAWTPGSTAGGTWVFPSPPEYEACTPILPHRMGRWMD